MSKLPSIFSTFVSSWWSSREDAYYDILDGIDEILREHRQPSAAAEELQDLLEPYGPDDPDTALYRHIWAVADDDRLGIGEPDDYTWYRFDSEAGCWHRENNDPRWESDEEPDYSSLGEMALHPLWWSNPEDTAELKHRVKKYRG